MTSEQRILPALHGQLFISLGLIGTATVLGVALVLSIGRMPQTAMPGLVLGETAGGVQTLASPIRGVVDLYAGKTLVHNLVPVISWEIDGQRFYNNAEIQQAAVELQPLEDGVLLTYETFGRVERVDGARPQPPSQVSLSLLVRDQGAELSLHPVVEANPNDLRLRIGIGLFFGIHHGTGWLEVGGSSGRRTVHADAYAPAGNLMSHGHWETLSNVRQVSLHSVLPGQPVLNLALSGCEGQLDFEVRNEPWIPQLAADRGLDQWVEATILYADASCFPLHLSLSDN